MAQQGVGELTLSGGGASSSMPHKQNPVLAELLVTLAHFNATQSAGMQHAMVHEQERSGATWALEWMLLPQMVLATGRGLVAADQVINAITKMSDTPT
jgi:3-carboxy-cis,cis-muconate cycloisomerase